MTSNAPDVILSIEWNEYRDTPNTLKEEANDGKAKNEERDARHLDEPSLERGIESVGIEGYYDCFRGGGGLRYRLALRQRIDGLLHQTYRTILILSFSPQSKRLYSHELANSKARRFLL